MSMDRTCQACNHRNDVGANFCSSCGERIGGGPDDPTAAIPVFEHPDQLDREHLADREAFAESTGILLVDDGPKSGSRYALDSPIITAGRHPESDIFLDDVTVSRRHVEIENVGGSYRAKDVGSLNGTYINKQLIDDAELVDGDELQIGRFKLLFFHGTAGADQ
ncbi:MAG: pSer/pThr/pTyr-binding forkhead associated (FHA) protein [Verrucomicrobiales bacterium]|jgi:pSer/pThr/pTyr-binding forkhead associated (FHA) protein